MPHPRKSDYEPISLDEIPAGVKWKPAPPFTGATRAYTSLFGNQYRLVRELATGEVRYFKRKDSESPASPKEQIDAEPKRKEQVRYRVGAYCWFIDAGRWFLVKVVKRGGKTIVLEPPDTRLDADGVAPWTFGDSLEFPARPNNPLFMRLRPLKDRSP